MPIRLGLVVDVEVPPVKKKAILRVTLHNGMRVYVPTVLLTEPFAEDTEYLFVERGPLGRTEWYGTLKDVPAAIKAGVMTRSEAESIGLTSEGELDVVSLVEDPQRFGRFHDAFEGRPAGAARTAGCLTAVAVLMAIALAAVVMAL